MEKLDKLVKLLFYYSTNDGFVSGHKQHRGLAPSLPGLQQQLQPEHAAQPGQGHGLLLLRVIIANLGSHNHPADILIIHLINIPRTSHQSSQKGSAGHSITQPCHRKCYQEQIAKLRSVKSDWN